MNLNQLAKAITEAEGKKVEVNISQVKEILNVLGSIMAVLEPEELFDVLKRLVK